MSTECRDTVVSEVPSQPALAPNVQLLGVMPDTGFVDPQWLIQRDGRFLQVTELLYRVAEQANGQRTLEEIAAAVTHSTNWIVDAHDVHQLIQTKLLPLRLVSPAGSPAGLSPGGVAAHGQTRSPLQINLRLRMLGPRLINPFSAVLQYLYSPILMIPILLAAGFGHWWIYGVHGIGAGIRDALYTPGALLAVLAIVLLGGVFHEFGHASALRYGGGKVRGMGVGLYLIYPAFYTDVTDGYRLGRWARLRTDLGGVYFHLIFSLGVIGLFAITGKEFLLFAVLIISADILRQFIPFARLDGYWVLADLTGIPDFFSQMQFFLRSLRPVQASAGSRLPTLKPWVKAAFAFYTLATVPLLAFLFVFMLIQLPGFLTKTWDSLLVQAKLFSGAAANRGFLLMTLSTAQMLLLALPALGSIYLIFSVSRVPVRALWRWTQLSGTRRMARALGAAACLAASTPIWIPKLGIDWSRRAPDLGDRLIQIRKATASIETLQAELEGTAGAGSFTGTVLLKRPNLARIDITGHEGIEDFVIASDGRDLWTYFPVENKFVRSIPGAQGRNIQAFLADQVVLFFRPEMIGVAGKGGDSTYAGRETVDGLSYDVMEVVTPGPPKRTVRYFISPTDNIIQRVVIKTEKEDGATSVRWASLKNVQTKLSVDQSAFQWAPPETASALQFPAGLLAPSNK